MILRPCKIKLILVIGSAFFNYNAGSALALKLPFRGTIANTNTNTNTNTKTKTIHNDRQSQIYSYPRGGDSDIINDYVNPEPCIDFPEDAIEPPKFGLLFIDRFCHYHGGYLAGKARSVYGVPTVNALSTYVSGYMSMAAEQQQQQQQQQQQLNGECESEPPSHLVMRIPSPDELEEWKRQIPFEILAILCESDSGLEEAELIGEAMGVRFGNGYNEARRDKFLMNDAVSKQGMRVVQQRMCATLEDAIEFATELGVVSDADADADADADTISDDDGNFDDDASRIGGDDDGSNNQNKESVSNGGQLGRATNSPVHLSSKSDSGKFCVVKPKRGVASDDVQFCSNLDEVKIAYNRVKGTSVFGSITGESNDAVLLQEFAAGTEYAIDIVSKDGHHKIAALWRYDKRQANGAPFVYFATELVDAQTPEGRIVCDYAMKALDALGLKHGLTHSEFIVDEEGARLVEVNCRQHNTNFAPLANGCIGYNALDLLLEAYLGDLPNLPIETEHLRLSWDDVPDYPITRACGAVVHLVCFQEGELIQINTDILDKIENLPSVYMMEIYDHFEVGNEIEKTIDIRTDSGWIHLINEDKHQFERDYNRIVELMPLMFTVKST